MCFFFSWFSKNWKNTTIHLSIIRSNCMLVILRICFRLWVPCWINMLNAYLEVSQLKILVISLLTSSETRLLRSVKALMKMPRKTESVTLLFLIPVIADLLNLNRFLKRKWINLSLVHLPSPVNWTVFQHGWWKPTLMLLFHLLLMSLTVPLLLQFSLSVWVVLWSSQFWRNCLDSNDFSNYRPVSNINFISKIIEKVASNQLKDYLCKNNLIDMYQSAYVSNRSTETALLKVKSDVLNAVDRQEVVFLVMLDLSAAFDTIDHALMLKHFETNMGISGCALQWLKSYLESRVYQVNIDGVLSETHKLDFGVPQWGTPKSSNPQGSVLGSLCFRPILYTSPVGKIIHKHGINFHFYADDTQMYISFNPKIPGACQSALTKLESCIIELSNWMTSYKLKLNHSKTEFFIAGTAQGLNKLPSIELEVGNNIIKPSTVLQFATSASYLTVICLWHNKLIVSSHLLIIISETSAVSLNFLIRTLNTMLSAVLFCLAWTVETRSCMAANPKTWIDFKLCKIRPLNSFSMLVNATVPLPCWTHYIGCPYGSASNINSACIFINVWMEQLRNISLILSHTNQKLLVSHGHQ